MKRLTITLTIFLVLLGAMPASADVPTDWISVRQMLTAPDNQDFSIFDQELLPDVLIDIIENDPEEAEYHEWVMSSALRQIGKLRVERSVELLVSHIADYSEICIYWLGTYTGPESIDALVGYLADESASLRYESAYSLSTLPDPEDEVPDGLMNSLNNAVLMVSERLGVEDDLDVVDALNDAITRLSELQAGILSTE